MIVDEDPELKEEDDKEDDEDGDDWEPKLCTGAYDWSHLSLSLQDKVDVVAAVDVVVGKVEEAICVPPIRDFLVHAC